MASLRLVKLANVVKAMSSSESLATLSRLPTQGNGTKGISVAFTFIGSGGSKGLIDSAWCSSCSFNGSGDSGGGGTGGNGRSDSAVDASGVASGGNALFACVAAVGVAIGGKSTIVAWVSLSC